MPDPPTVIAARTVAGEACSGEAWSLRGRIFRRGSGRGDSTTASGIRPIFRMLSLGYGPGECFPGEGHPAAPHLPRSTLSAARRGRDSPCIRLMFNARHTRFHSPRTASMPRTLNCRNPIARLIHAFGASDSHFRSRYASRHSSVSNLLAMRSVAGRPSGFSAAFSALSLPGL